MMESSLDVTIATPFEVLADESGALALRAEDESGSFGILPGHVDFLTVLPASVVRWRRGDGTMRYCALRGGVLTVSGGNHVSIACRRGAVGDDLSLLAAEVTALQALDDDAERRARTAQTRMHARAVRQLMRYLHPKSVGTGNDGAP
jgi:F-type H+-transporting ATPase subunit epsilon